MDGVQTLVVIGTDCTGSCKSNYHTITAMTAPFQYFIDPSNMLDHMFRLSNLCLKQVHRYRQATLKEKSVVHVVMVMNHHYLNLIL